MKNNLIYSNYDNETGVSKVIIENKYGIFEDVALLHPDDKIYESNFFGCQIAEARCMIQTRKAQIEEINFKIKTLQTFENVLKNSKHYNPQSFECRKLRKQIYLLNKEKQDLLHTIQKIKENIINSETKRRTMLQKIHAVGLLNTEDEND